MSTPPTDDAGARRSIVEDLDVNLFVEAGAGTGKTTALVSRVVSLVRGGTPVTSLVVITFTRAAAAELRERVRQELSRARDDPAEGSGERELLAAALRDIDVAVIQTIDAFALSLLRERPIDAGLPPVIEPLDAVQSDLLFDEAWAGWLDAQEDGGEFASALSDAFRLGLESPVSKLYDAARAFHGNYSLVRGRNLAESGAAPRIARDEVVKAGRWLPGLARFCKLADGDALTRKLDEFEALATRLGQDGVTGLDADWILARQGRIKASGGRQPDWEADESGVNACKLAKDELARLQEIVDEEFTALRRHVLGRLLTCLQGFVVGFAERRKAEGLATFDDMLVWSVDLLENSEAARDHFQKRFSHVLIDEFQDTDPLQVRLAVRLTDRDGTGRPSPGALFLVGDPKQSIYRFRHADLPTLRRIKEDFGDGLRLLTRNFRSAERILDWVNRVFGERMGTAGGEYQADYVPLEPGADQRQWGPECGVHVVGEAMDARVEDVRRVEMRALARTAREIGDGLWSVSENGAARPSRLEDLCILIPARTVMPMLERSLEDESVPYTTVGQSLVLASNDVRDLVNAMAAIDDPSDQVSLAAALRSPAYACSDSDLWAWVNGGNRLDYLGEAQGSGPVAEAFESLRRFHRLRLRLSPSELIERFARDRRLREIALLSNQPGDRWSRIKFLIETSRDLADNGMTSLRDVVAWARQQAERDLRAPESGAGEVTGAVRVMTVHAAKGLEFPIVMMTGLNSPGSSRSGAGLFDYRPGSPAPVAVRLKDGGATFETGSYNALQEQVRDAGEMERIRVMYVAATRARDHLIVSTYRDGRDASTPAAVLARICEEAPDTWAALPPLSGDAGAAHTHPAAAPAGYEDPAAWQDERDRVVRAMSAPLAVPASSLHAPGETVWVDKTETEQVELDPWRRGRAASALGRAVHAVLQDVDLADPSELAALAAEYSAAHGVAGREAEVRRLAEATLRTPVMQRAASAHRNGRAWRESYTSAAIGEPCVVVEGYMDLVFEDEDGRLVIVDYKTDRDSAAPQRYEAQLGAYVAAVRAATGREVGDAVLVFSRSAADALETGGEPAQAEHHLADVDAAVRLAIELATAAAAG